MFGTDYLFRHHLLAADALVRGEMHFKLGGQIMVLVIGSNIEVSR